MISIIISSYKEDLFNQLSANIAETCGVPYEIIQVENPGKMGICEAYNLGSEKAVFENLLFVHEDVLFHTKNWGEKLAAHLQDEKTGVIGIAGSDYVPKAPAGWYVNSIEHHFLHLIQNTKEGDKPVYDNLVSEKKHKVFAIDGVFLAINSNHFEKIGGFSKTLKGFHAYDTDFSLKAAKNYQNYVVNDILIEHFSLGSPNKSWFEDTLEVRKLLGSDFHLKKDSEIEKERFLGFLHSYFLFNGITINNALKSMKFLPFQFLNGNQKKEVLMSYIRYFRYRKYYQNKFK